MLNWEFECRARMHTAFRSHRRRNGAMSFSVQRSGIRCVIAHTINTYYKYIEEIMSGHTALLRSSHVLFTGKDKYVTLLHLFV
jgi:hypothetical protein